MQIHFLCAASQTDEAQELEIRLRSKWPALQRIASLEVERSVPQLDGARRKFAIIPLLEDDIASFDHFIAMADRIDSGYFLIFVSREIGASDYKRLMRSERADWASLKDAPGEIDEIIQRNLPGASTQTAEEKKRKPLVVAFVPSAGGVGNATLAVESAVQLKLDKKTRHYSICIVDLELQTSHTCDYLDIEPRLRMDEIVADPKRLDRHLFDLFVSHHSSGVDVLAASQKRTSDIALNMDALEALFEIIAASYDIVILDLPLRWHKWTPTVLSACDLVVVTGLNTVPGLRQVAGTVASIKDTGSAADRVVVALNRCEPGILSGIARGSHISKVLGSQRVLTIREDTKAATESANAGVPMAIGRPSSRGSKDIRAITDLIMKAATRLAEVHRS